MAAFHPLRTLLMNRSVHRRFAPGWEIEVKFVRAPNKISLLAAAIALVLLATLSARAALANAHHYRVPGVILAGGAIRDVVFAAALLFAALSRSRFAGPTSTIIATLLTFVVTAPLVIHFVAFGSVHPSWWDAIYLALAAAIAGPSLFPWSASANWPVLFCVVLTFAAATLLLGSAAVVARL
jgi:hypothetical protein